MKVLASDFDGTLYFQEIGYKEPDIEAILQFQQKGNKFGFCTGRPLLGIVHFLDHRITPDFYILNSGAYILDDKRRCLYKNTIAFEICTSLVEQYSNCAMTILSEKYIYYTMAQEHHHKHDIFKPYAHLNREIEILGISLHLDDNQMALETAEKIRQSFHLDAFVNMGSIDCVAKGCSKSTGIQAIKKHYGLNQEIACIGDNYNDLPMLESSALSFTFTNSPEPVKAAANYLVDSLSECVALLLED